MLPAYSAEVLDCLLKRFGHKLFKSEQQELAVLEIVKGKDEN